MPDDRTRTAPPSRPRPEPAGTRPASRLVPVAAESDIFPPYRGTPIGDLLINHNLRPVIDPVGEPRLVVATCMDHRVNLNMPVGFALILRTAGASVEPLVFNVLAAMAVRDIRAVAIIGHSDCAMLDVERHRQKFIATATELGTMSEAEAAKLFEKGASRFGFENSIAQTLAQCEHLHKVVPGALIAPLSFDVKTGALSQIVE